PAEIHSKQHLGPILGFGAASAWMNGDNGVLSIVLATEHFLDFGSLHFLVERVERLSELGINLLASFGPFNEHGQIVALLSQRFDQIAILFKTPATLQDSLGLGLIFPEVWRSGARFQSGKFFLRAGSLKDSSAGRQLACSSLRSGASTRRDSTCSPVPL